MTILELSVHPPVDLAAPEHPEPFPDLAPAMELIRGVAIAGLGGRALHRAVSYMSANLDRKITLNEIAGAACISRFHFARLFRQSTGYSAMEYLTLLRIRAGAQLLVSGGTPIKAIAQQLGFSDQSHFSRHFRKTMGVTPSTYSRLHDPRLGVESTDPLMVQDNFG